MNELFDILRREGIYLWYYFSVQLEQIVSYWVLGMVIGSVVSVFGKEHIHTLFSRLNGKGLGLLVRFFYQGKSFFNFTGFSVGAGRDVDPDPFLRLLKNFGRNVRATGPYFLLGILLSALFQRYVPAGAVAGLFGNNRGFGVLMAAAIGVPLYACGGGTIPLLIQWLNDGMSMGSAAAFMITGPATKITNLGALKIVFGFRRFLLYLIFILLFAFGTGLLVDFVLVD